MGELIRLSGERRRPTGGNGVRGVRRDGRSPDYAVASPASASRSSVSDGLTWITPHLISQPDAAIRTNLREQTRRVLATLLPREEQVLRMRFGIGDGRCTARSRGHTVVLSRTRLLAIEWRALRKLRTPGWRRLLHIARRA